MQTRFINKGKAKTQAKRTNKLELMLMTVPEDNESIDLDDTTRKLVNNRQGSITHADEEWILRSTETINRKGTKKRPNDLYDLVNEIVPKTPLTAVVPKKRK